MPSLLGFLGGTGPEGRGLALRFAIAGEKVLIGSRDQDRASSSAAAVAALAPPGLVRGALNAEVARTAEVVFVTLPYRAQRATLAPLVDALAGKTVVSVVAPVEVVKGHARAVPVEEGSAALQAQAILVRSAVVSAFQTISARDLLEPARPIDSDVVVCADDVEAKALVMRLAAKIEGLRAVDGGGLDNARYVEDLTALLLNINRIYRAHSAIKIAGI